LSIKKITGYQGIDGGANKERYKKHSTEVEKIEICL
jgi:hypothetical protein